MSNYQVKLTPEFRTPVTEGGLDSSVVNGKSTQRTFNMYEVINNACSPKACRKMISGHDGDTYNDTTFQNSDGVGTFEVGVNLAFDPNYVGEFIELSNNNCTASFTDDGDVNETTVLTNYAIKSGEKAVFSMVTTYGGYDGYTGVGIGGLQTDVEEYLGEGNDSIGFWDDGKVYFGGPPITLNLSFKQDNTVDVAVDRVNNLIWFRVDGGDWNGDNTQNPETGTGGIDISDITGDAYPGACPYSYDGIFGQISINDSVSNPPTGFKVLTGSEEVALKGYYYFNGNDDVYWNNLNNWNLFGGAPASRLPNSNDNVKIFAAVRSSGGSIPTVQNMFVSTTIGSGEFVFGIEINVSGIASFYGPTYIQTGDGFATIAKINGNCVFYGTDSGPYATISAADAVVNGNATFYGDSNNFGTITGNAIFNGNSYNYDNGPIYGIVEGNAIFNDDSVNDGIVEGNATFNDNSNNNGTVNGTVNCNTTGTCQTNLWNTSLVEVNESVSSMDISIGGQLLHPSFSREIEDYCVLAPSNDGDVGYTLSYNSKSISGSVRVGKTIKVADGSKSFYIRVLPSNFALGIPEKLDLSYVPGYYLSANTFGTGAPYYVVYDQNGVPVWFAKESNSYQVASLHPGIENNSVITNPFGGPRTALVLKNGGFIQAQSFNMLHSPTYGDPSWEVHEARKIKLPASRAENIIGQAYFNGIYIQEQSVSNDLVWEWSSNEYFSSQDPETYHVNSLDVHPVTGNIVVSMRSVSAVMCIEYSTKDVLWAIDPTEALRAQAISPKTDNTKWLTINNEPEHGAHAYNGTSAQHDARWHVDITPLTAGNDVISIYDDESFNGYDARGVVYEINYANGTATQRSSIFCPGTSGYMGSYTILAENGSFSHTIDAVQIHPCTLEYRGSIDGEKTAVFRMDLPGDNYRIIKVPNSFFDINILRYTCGINADGTKPDYNA